MSEARERYQALYEEEKELNETFSQFVYNYKSAYEGRNTRVVQIIDTQVKHNKDYRKEKYYELALLCQARAICYCQPTVTFWMKT